MDIAAWRTTVHGVVKEQTRPRLSKCGEWPQGDRSSGAENTEMDLIAFPGAHSSF